MNSRGASIFGRIHWSERGSSRTVTIRHAVLSPPANGATAMPAVLRLLSGAFYYDTTRRNIRIGVMPIEVARCSSAEKPLGMRNVCPEIESR